LHQGEIPHKAGSHLRGGGISAGKVGKKVTLGPKKKGGSCQSLVRRSLPPGGAFPQKFGPKVRKKSLRSRRCIESQGVGKKKGTLGRSLGGYRTKKGMGPLSNWGKSLGPIGGGEEKRVKSFCLCGEGRDIVPGLGSSGQNRGKKKRKKKKRKCN